MTWATYIATGSGSPAWRLDLGGYPFHFVTRSDVACGSTIGPITAARVGIRTVDVGSPMLAMHSCRELAAVADVAPMIDLLAAVFEG